MESQLRSRLIGAAILIGLAVIFVPMLLEKPAAPAQPSSEEIPLDIPSPPDADGMQTRTLPIEQAPIPEIDATAPDPIAQVDTARAQPVMDHLPDETSGQIQRQDAVVPESEPESVPEPASAPDAITASPPRAPANTAEVAGPATKPEPTVAKAPSADGGRFGINFGSYGTQANAQKLVGQLSKLGVQAKIENNNADGKTLFRVAARGYSNRTRAEQARLAAVNSVNGLTASIMQGEIADENAPISAVKPALQGFALQLGVFADKAKADDLIAKLKAQGFAAYPERIVTASGASHRVRVGPLTQRADADKTKASIKSKLNLDAFVVPYP